MKAVHFGARAGLLALACSLAACGGGGGAASTPPPTTNPNPAPGTPTPSPPPTGVNASLIGTLQSETFVNDATGGSSSYPTNGASGSASAAPSTLSVVYSASSQSYTLTVGARTQSFNANQPDPVLTNSQIAVYVVPGSGTTDTLTLTKPGTAGSLNYQYVGSGYWQRTTNGTSTISATLDAFSYGAQTTAAAVPRTGNASYAIELLGTVAYTDGPSSLKGTGTLLARFGTGALEFNGSVQQVSGLTGQPNGTFPFAGNATLSATANAFSGTMSLAGLPATGSSLTGRFYGPTAQELGASWSVNFGGGAAGVGTILGRLATVGAVLTSPATYSVATGSQVELYPLDSAGNQNGQAYSDGSYTPSSFTIGGPNDAFVYRVTDGFHPAAAFTANDQSAALSTNSWIVYRTQGSAGANELYLLKPGSANPLINLSYASLGYWAGVSTGTLPMGGTSLIHADRFFAFGQQTDFAFRPTTGTAAYSGVLAGFGYGRGATTFSRYTLDGNFQVTFNFSGNSLAGTARPSITNVNGGSPIALGDIPILGNVPVGTTFFANLGSGGFSGAFYGPNLEEIAGTFQTSLANPAVSGETVQIVGGFAGKK